MKVTYKSGLSGTANRYALDPQREDDVMVLSIQVFSEPNTDSDEWCHTSCGYCLNDEVGNGIDTFVIINDSDLVCNTEKCKAEMLEDYMGAEKIHDEESGMYITASGQHYDSCCEYENSTECSC